MDKLYFKTRKEEIQSKIDSCKKEMKELENEYIVSNQKFPIEGIIEVDTEIK